MFPARRLTRFLVVLALLASLLPSALPAAPKAKPVVAVVYITKTGKCFHRDGCSSLRRSKIKCTRTEAVNRGLRPCKTCRPWAKQHSTEQPDDGRMNSL